MTNKRDAVRNQQRTRLDKGMERTFTDTDPAPGDQVTGLGKPSKITRAKKPKDEALPAPVYGDPLERMKAQILAQNNTSLRAKTGLPTLAERVAAEGIKAYGMEPRAKKKTK